MRAGQWPGLYVRLLSAFMPLPALGLSKVSAMHEVYPQESLVVTQIAAGCMEEEPGIVWRVLDLLGDDAELQREFLALIPERMRGMASHLVQHTTTSRRARKGDGEGTAVGDSNSTMNTDLLSPLWHGIPH